MSIYEPVEHGGALFAAERAFPGAPKPWLDLSTGINPIPYPVGEIAARAWTRLPEREEIAELEGIAARAYGVGDPACVVAAPGAQSLIQFLPYLFPARRVGVLGPTYGEHAHRWRAGGAHVSITDRLEVLNESDVAIVVNPNNPDGRATDTDALRLLAASLAGREGMLVVDESFADALPRSASLVPHIPDLRAIVIRSFGKFFGLGGLRLGFAVAPRALADKLRDAIGPWAVSGPAVSIGSRALADEVWRGATVARLTADCARLDAMFRGATTKAVRGTALFRYVEDERAPHIHAGLCRSGILTRIFAERPGCLRFGLPGDRSAWDRLAEALKQFW